jgi:hypothetical protein
MRVEAAKKILRTAKEDGLSVKERQALRNKISAQNSRIRKKQESIFLARVVEEKDSKMIRLIEAITQVASAQQLAQIHSKICDSWGLPAD